MLRRVTMAAVVAVVTAAIIGPAALAQDSGDYTTKQVEYGDDVYSGTDGTTDSGTSGSTSGGAWTKFTAKLAGSNEVGGGDPNGSGTAAVKVRGTEVCFDVKWSGFEAIMSHIHKAVEGKAGPIVVPFFKSEQGAVSGQRKQGCTEVSAELAKGIAEHPANYYVNVHDVEFPKGAIRGQLAPAGADVGAQLPNTGSFRSRGLLLLSLSIVAAGSLLLAVGQRRRRPSHVRR